jgi:SpoVK/Ycf46/Vps4 family AAA+-type ATPase
VARRFRQRTAPLGRVVLDKNERFVILKCIAYLERIINKYPSLDRHTLDFVVWVLGPEMEVVGERATAMLSGPKRDELAGTLEECLADQSDYPHALMRCCSFIKSFRPRLMNCLREALERRKASLANGAPSEIERNMETIGDMFRLSEAEVELCLLSFLTSQWSPVESYLDSHLECFRYPGQKYLAAALQVSRGQIRKMLEGNLTSLGMLVARHNNKVEMNDDFLGFLQNPSPGTLPGQLFTPLRGEVLPLEYHLIDKVKIEHALALLKARPRTATHLLLYGPAGTGKSTLARTLAKKVGLRAFEIVRGDGNTTEERRAAIRACLNMTNVGEGSTILVDEADNVLNTVGSWMMRGETQDKGWLNDLLEEPGARMIWIVNHTCGIEESVRRRFAFSLEFKPFGKQQRLKLWQAILRRNRAAKFLAPAEVKELAARYKLNAGPIDLAIKKARETGASSRKAFREAVIRALEASQTLLVGDADQGQKEAVEQAYSLEGLNTEGDLVAMMARLEAFDRYLRTQPKGKVINMNLLFYGPPGTGKSELARHTAARLDRELLVRRASDIFDKYVGETESNIRKAFTEAEAEEAVLVIDEADSLLFTRERAERSWEVSFTNEFLTQMERFRGILICTTNRLDDVDSAAMRRFNHKIAFKYLTPEGNVIFYRRLLSGLSAEGLNERWLAELRAIKDLAPGDFKVVRDKFSFSPPREVRVRDLLEALREEARLKPTHRGDTAMGF